ncbi:MAG: hypothetical protein AAF901_13425 [Bacteroidota bacterium]
MKKQGKELEEAIKINPGLAYPEAQVLFYKYLSVLFSHQPVKHFEISISLKPDANVSQHRSRAVPAALQDCVDTELKDWEKAIGRS